MARGTIYSTEEILIIGEYHSKLTLEGLMAMLPNRSRGALQKKLYLMGINALPTPPVERVKLNKYERNARRVATKKKKLEKQFNAQ